MTSALEHGTEDTPGRLGAVLRAAGSPQPVALGRHGPWLATTSGQARRVLTDPLSFDFPSDVSRRLVPEGSGQGRSPHALFAPLDRDRAARATEVLGHELVAGLDVAMGCEVDAMLLLRRPMARATVAATLPGLGAATRDEIADAVLGWVDALGPVISAARPPGRWSRARRAEDAALTRLVALLADLDDPAPASTAALLAAGTQVPIAAGAWLLVALAERPDLQQRLASGEVEPVSVVWEVLRLTPPTWITARVTTACVDLAGVRLPAGSVVLVSPLLLGRLDDLVPSAGDELEEDRGSFCPDRWEGSRVRPGSWLPFGAGPHACPGRSVGMAQLVALATWAGQKHLRLAAPAVLDQSRGIFPRPASIVVGLRDEVER
jgi:hypothetical protein